MDNRYAFLVHIQGWIQKHQASRQLSPLDIYTALRWQASGVFAVKFTKIFDEEIKNGNIDSNHISFTKLNDIAEKIIKKYAPKFPLQSQIQAPNPFREMLQKIAVVGKNCENPLVRKELKEIYRKIQRAEKERLLQEDGLEAYYSNKAEALMLWDQLISGLLASLEQFLSSEEIGTLRQLSASQEAKSRLMSCEASDKFSAQIYKENLAKYFKIADLL